MHEASGGLADRRGHRSAVWGVPRWWWWWGWFGLDGRPGGPAPAAPSWRPPPETRRRRAGGRGQVAPPLSACTPSPPRCRPRHATRASLNPLAFFFPSTRSGWNFANLALDWVINAFPSFRQRDVLPFLCFGSLNEFDFNGIGFFYLFIYLFICRNGWVFFLFFWAP